ncbi:respiratory chain complex I subunit 1 family protein [Paludibacterium yongneupense]|uniref:respiratory chain complex I subunit 1 family protein n=1 Tax=Paludibacterium yongneupense TaxID=400061 RepID=UPI0004253A2D|nr:respiratory chain complex I subunit 1 family protein [Paludibacterium yongneupense]
MQTMIFLAILQALVLLAVAPLFSGLSRVLRAKMHSRRGPGVLQDYRDLVKLLKRQDVATADSGPIFRVMPYVLFGSMLAIATVLPLVTTRSPLGAAGDLITVVYLFALSRFFFSLSGLDTGSTFGAIGASRELTLGVLVEPIMMLALFVAALIEGTTNLGGIGLGIATGHYVSPTAIALAGAAFGFAAFIEMGKMPFDLAEAEQELQEGPLTEYSGSALALLKWGLALKKLVVAQMFLGVFIPFGQASEMTAAALAFAAAVAAVKLLVVFLLSALVENSVARGRFMLTPKVTWIGFGVASLAFVFYLTGL